MAPATPWVDVTRFDKNWDPNHPVPGKRFNWNWPSFPNVPTPPGLKSIRTLQGSVAGLFGFPAGSPTTGLRHEPPRRFRIVDRNENIRHGAVLLLGVPANPGNPKSTPVMFSTMQLFPTRYTGGSGHRIWETTVEADPRVTLGLTNGGPWAPDVVKVAHDKSSGGALDPTGWNWFLVYVYNEDSTLTTNPQWHRLEIQDTR